MDEDGATYVELHTYPYEGKTYNCEQSDILKREMVLASDEDDYDSRTMSL